MSKATSYYLAASLLVAFIAARAGAQFTHPPFPSEYYYGGQNKDTIAGQIYTASMERADALKSLGYADVSAGLTTNFYTYDRRMCVGFKQFVTSAVGFFMDRRQWNTNDGYGAWYETNVTATIYGYLYTNHPQLTITSLLAAVGAPTNYCDHTPWQMLNGGGIAITSDYCYGQFSELDYGWKYAPAILSMMTDIRCASVYGSVVYEKAMFGNANYWSSNYLYSANSYGSGTTETSIVVGNTGVVWVAAWSNAGIGAAFPKLEAYAMVAGVVEQQLELSDSRAVPGIWEAYESVREFTAPSSGGIGIDVDRHGVPFWNGTMRVSSNSTIQIGGLGRRTVEFYYSIPPIRTNYARVVPPYWAQQQGPYPDYLTLPELPIVTNAVVVSLYDASPFAYSVLRRQASLSVSQTQVVSSVLVGDSARFIFDGWRLRPEDVAADGQFAAASSAYNCDLNQWTACDAYSGNNMSYDIRVNTEYVAAPLLVHRFAFLFMCGTNESWECTGAEDIGER